MRARKFAKDFAQLTDGLPLVALADIAQLADRQGIAFRDVDDAVQCYKVGVTENPWKKDYLRERIAGALPFIEERVRGQRQAVTKTIDILMRSVMGLTGAQARSSGNRPRGVLFFAGPTGVGKTELAKTLTQLIFGDERAYIRFDMSEFAEEHTGARLLGAPPGYIGYDAGGELTNSVREKPFSVVLFDEIEKAHPRILDKFLQILEDGRLTDGRGETAYFSEAILVFTSNLGIFVEDEHGQRVQSVQPGDAHEVVEARVRGAIQDYFKYKLSRPEILNRIGDNIIVFGFITPEIGAQIFDGMLRNVVNRVRDEHKVDLVVDARREGPPARAVHEGPVQRRPRHRQPAGVAVRQSAGARDVPLPAGRPHVARGEGPRRGREPDHDRHARVMAACPSPQPSPGGARGPYARRTGTIRRVRRSAPRGERAGVRGAGWRSPRRCSSTRRTGR